MPDCCEQMELPLLTPLSFDEILTSKGIRNLTVIPSTRLKSSWRIKIHTLSGRRTLSVPSYFENAPEKIKEAIIEWSLLFPLTKHRKQPGFKQRKKILEHLVLEYIAASGNAHRNVRKVAPSAFQSLGCRYDLKEVLCSLNASYFKGSVVSFIRWNTSSSRSYQSTFTDTQGQRHNLISIAQIYNRPDVPRFAVEGIVFHEMLHISIPPYKRNLQNIIHGREFKRAEQSFPYFRQWRQWEKERLKKNHA